MRFVCFMALVCAALSANAAGRSMDFDGDGRADVGVYNATGGWSILQSANGTPRQVTWGTGDTRPVLGDFDGDGKADFAVQNQQSGRWYVSQSGSGTLLQDQLGGNAERPVPADYDGDGKTDIAVYNRTNGVWTIKRSSDGQMVQFTFGGKQGRPVPADYDGDGKADPAYYERATGNWHLWLSGSGQQTVINWGSRDMRPVPADYDGDGKADIASYDAKTGNWYILQSSNGQARIVNWGWSQARPVPADYDGDGKADIAVFQRATGNWYILQSSNGQVRQLNWGTKDTAALPLYRDGGVNGEIILAFGDSITYGTASSSNGPDTGYPMLLEHKLNALQGGHFATANGGNPGDQTANGLIRLPGWLASEKPDLMLLMMGTNDEYYKDPFNVTARNLVRMIAMAQRAGASVMLATIPPVITNSGHDRSQQEQLIEQFNPTIYKIGQLMGVPVVPVWESITAVPNWQNTLMDQSTANHPNDAGYQVVRDAFYKVIDQNLQNGNLW